MFIKLLKKDFKNIYLNKLIKVLLGVLFLIIVLLLCASLISQVTMKKRFLLIINYYWRLNREAMQLGYLTSEASYLLNFYLTRNEFDEARDYFTQKIDTAIDSINFFLVSMKIKQSQVNEKYIEKILKDILVILQTYRHDCLKRLDKAYELYELGKNLSQNNHLPNNGNLNNVKVISSSLIYREKVINEINQVEREVSESYSLLSVMFRVVASEIVIKSELMKITLERAVNIFSMIIIISFIILGMIVISIFIIFQKRIFFPLNTFMKAITETKKGKKDIIIKVQTGDEFGMLARKFNEMTFAVRSREETLMITNQEIERQKREVERLKHYVEEIIHASPNTVITFDNDSRIVFANRKAQEILGEISVISGKNLKELEGPFSVYQDLIIEVIASLKEKTLIKEEVPGYDKQVFNIFIYPLRKEPGGGAVMEAEDITERVLMEEKIIESQKMETVGLLAGGFAHDFNNLLTGIVGYLELAKNSEDTVKKIEYINRVLEISSTAAKLVDQILLFSRTGPGKKESLSVGELIDSSINMIGLSVKRNVKIVKKIDNPDKRIYVNGAQIKLMLLNIILNSIESIGKKQNGEVVVEAESYNMVYTENKREIGALPTNLKNDFIRIAIKDNGAGMTEDIKEHIFDPFFTTKVRGSTKGTGLGLSIVYQIIKNHNGEINVQSSPGSGTTVEIILPVSEPGKTLRVTEHSILKTGGTVLLVEDEDMVRRIEERMLNNLGYRVIALQNGLECIEYFNKKNRIPDLLIIDLVMPDMDGSETLKKLADMGVRVPVLIASGYITLDMSYLKNYDLVRGILKKPFNIDELSKKISRIMAFEKTKKGS